MSNHATNNALRSTNFLELILVEEIEQVFHSQPVSRFYAPASRLFVVQQFVRRSFYFFGPQVINNKKSLPLDRLTIILSNVSDYIDCILMENLSVAWGPFLALAEVFFRRVSFILSTTFDSFTPFIKIIIRILRIPGIILFKASEFILQYASL